MPHSSSRQSLVCIVTPVFNGIEFTRKYLDSLRHQTYKNFKVIIIDDGSTDGTSLILTKHYPETIVLQGNGHLWWSGGTNLGVKYAEKLGAKYVLTINNDLKVSKDYIESLVSFAEAHPNSLVGSMVLNRAKPKEVWFFGGTYRLRKGLNEHIVGTVDEFTRPVKSTWLTGMGVLVPIHVFKKIGYYDEKNFPQYFGDADFSERARRAGFDLWVSPASKVYADIYENWIGRNLKRPKIRFIYDMMTNIRSPFQWKTRHLYYKLYWPGNYRLALMMMYTFGSASVYLGYIIGLMKRVLNPLGTKK